MKRFLKSWLRGRLEQAGYEMRRTGLPADQVAAPATPTAGRIIEFIGPSGVGKSTVFEAAAPQLQARWFFAHHARLTYRPGQVSQKIDAAHHALLAGRIRAAEKAAPDLWEHCDLLSRLEEIVKQSLVAASGTYPRGFVFDEGIGHFFAEQFAALDADALRACLARRSYVLILPKLPEIIVTRLLDRARRTMPAAALTQFEAKVRTDGFLADIARQFDVYRDFAALAEDAGCALLRLDAEDRVAENAARVLAFEAAVMA